jgi:uncharacterized protein
MDITELLFTCFLFLVIATIYSSVGHAGSSGYLAIMALLSFAPESIKPTSLILNIAVSAIASLRYIKEDLYDKKVLLPFILTSIPMAFLGGYITLNPKFFKLIAGIFLLIAALLLMVREYLMPKKGELRKMPFSFGLGIGGVIGLISGLIGVGGGIFLSPVIISANWVSVRQASGIAAIFIFFNSLAGLSGHLAGLNKIDHYIIYWLIAVVIGGFLGSHLGTVKLNTKIIIVFLFIVLLTAGLKLLVID